ncbi:MAG: hypothetical protein NWR47_02505 [Aestuariivirgaceae bacterium]|nr:hypothetical protein [Aestuariivirgaceae bacterium]
MDHRDYMTKGENRDKKLTISASGKDHIYWLLSRQPLPKSRWHGVDIERFRELRRLKGGTKRAAAFFEENIGRPFHRSIVQALLFDQDDYMKRLRRNGGARELLGSNGILLLSGTCDSKKAVEYGFKLARDEMLAVYDNSRP